MSQRASRSYRAQAIVLKHREYDEADRILTLYTLEHGKLQAIAKGARKVKSRKAGHLEPFTLVLLQLAKGRTWEVIAQAEAQKTFQNIRDDLTLTAQAAYLVELIDRFSYEEGPNRALFQTLADGLQRLNEGFASETVVHYFELRLLENIGFRPELNRCLACDAKIQPEPQYYSPKLGGVLCPKCFSVDLTAWRISLNALKYLRYFQRSSWSKIKNRVIPPEIEQEIKHLIQHHFTYLLEKNLKTPDFLKAVN
ncbi:MAG: DNA repair protein RecO [Chloroflexi bacterium]|nr:DNA repair protein RecO [Chloroflexota bacterium]